MKPFTPAPVKPVVSKKTLPALAVPERPVPDGARAG